MRIISRKLLKIFWSKHKAAESSLKAWFADVKNSDWHSPADIKNIYKNASFLSDNRVVFNIKGNQYRLIVKINYKAKIVFLRFVGTHKDYDKIDALTI